MAFHPARQYVAVSALLSRMSCHHHRCRRQHRKTWSAALVGKMSIIKIRWNHYGIITSKYLAYFLVLSEFDCNYFFSSQSPKEALLETDNISVHATRRTSDPVGDSGRLNSGGSGLYSPLHGTNNPYAQGVLNQKALANSPSKAAAAAGKGAIFVGSPTKNQNILFYPDGSAATAVQTIAAPAAAFLIRSPVKSAESAWQRARNDLKIFV